MRAVVLLQAHHVLHLELALEVGHVADVRAAEGVDRLVVVADRERTGVRRRNSFSQRYCSRLVSWNSSIRMWRKRRAIVLAQDFIPRQQLVTSAAEVLKNPPRPHAGIARRRRCRARRSGACCRRPSGTSRPRTPSSLLPLMKYCTSRGGKRSSSTFMPFSRRLIAASWSCESRIWNAARQAGFARVRAQHAVAQAVEGADPHAARVDRHHRADARQHLARRLVGEGDREDARGRDAPALDQPGDARGQDAGLAAARAGEDQRVLVRQGDCG